MGNGKLGLHLEHGRGADVSPEPDGAPGERPTIDHWIDGRLVAGTSPRISPVHDPALGVVTKTVALATPEEVGAAIAAAKAAFPRWRDSPRS